ncbi:hypothetical protein OV203_28975 [Nannocystis sp. ILAH1]|uniref:hypothetical protein n=1 Tax=unclassified Nannocystis TaxID=2627009 RepID=UPI00226F3ECE|nr:MULTISPECIES: hypothetical protein [unclassified Nannocystis]MCY0991214.1 hypothetical protein [Nannocystis sp. ILAH1]MCY1064728.1 hypothetical protein [Nannocystis sp. RBIL2]
MFATVVAAACGSDTDPLASAGPTTNTTAPGPGPSSGAASTDDEPTSTATATDAGTDTGSEPTSTTGGMEPSQATCDQYLECLAATAPAMLPDAQAGFGPMGTCWQGSPETIQQCIDACATGLAQQHALFPDEPKCFECLETGDCPPGERCTSGTCDPPKCGDGIVDADEVCDNPAGGCQDCDAVACNPLTNVGCQANEACQLLHLGDSETFVTCIPGEPLPPGAPCPDLGDNCGLGNTCALAEYVPDCDSTLCCALLCNLQDGNVCPDGHVCVEYVENSPLGNLVGLCAPE